MNMPEIDSIDRQILRRLQEDGRASVAKIADEVGLSEAPCWRRVKRLQDMGLVSRFVALLDRRELGFTVFAVVHIRFSVHLMEQSQGFEEQIQRMPEVLTCHNVAGEDDYIITVVAEDLDKFGQFTLRLRSLSGVTAIHSNLSLREVKNTTALPV